MSLNDKQVAELEFWRALVAEKGDGYYAYRTGEYQDKTEHFPSFDGSGVGLDLCCGCVSVFDASPWNIFAVDALMDEYRKLYRGGFMKAHLALDGENLVSLLPAASVGYVFCLNAADHTPSPECLFASIRHVLKPHGKLFFEVNFDDSLAGPHYSLWTRETVNHYLKEFTLLHEFTERLDCYGQSRFWAEYER